MLRKGSGWLCVRGELETGTDCNILTQSSSRDHSSTSSLSWLGCSTVGRWEPQALCLELVLTPRASYLQLRLELNWNWLTQAICGTWLYVCRPPASCGFTHLHRIQPRPQVKVIFRHPRPDAPVIYTGAFLDWRLDRGSICNIRINRSLEMTLCHIQHMTWMG